MTIVYWIRHAQSDSTISDPVLRPLTEKGIRDRALITDYLRGKDIRAAFSSPYKRAVDTIADFTEKAGLEIRLLDGFREHETVSDAYPDADYFPFIQKYWADKHYKVPGDESFAELQSRNIRALEQVLLSCEGQNVIIGTHGMALASVLQYYDERFGYPQFLAMVARKPWIVKMDFAQLTNCGITCIDPIAPVPEP